MAAFPEEVAAHAYGGGCGRPVLGALPLPGSAAPPADEGPAAEPAEQLVVDWTLCRGHGLCADLAPGVVRLGPDGYPQQAAMALPARMRRRARLAVRRCPALALRVRPAPG
ncbi:hypothetical protein CCS38_21270 [Streptomyces purpurogeneiscleroticus]|nr:hypothetical protein [Streptomyces purpurogeneiscleroticus]